MYTSCGWFFDEISGIETVQIIAYAGRVLQLAAKLFGEPGVALEAEFLAILAKAKSNIPEMANGAEVYRRYVTSMRIGLEQVGAHYAISSIFRSYPENGELFCFDVHRDSHEIFNSGRGRVALGRARVSLPHHRGERRTSASPSSISATRTSPPPSSPTTPPTPTELAAFATFSTEIGNAMRRANLPEVIRLIDHFFGGMAYSLTSLFADEQHRILNTILNRTALRDGGLAAQDLRGPRLSAPLPHRVRHRRSPALAWPPASPSTPACAAPSRPKPSTRSRSIDSSTAPKPTRSPRHASCSASPPASA